MGAVDFSVYEVLGGGFQPHYAKTMANAVSSTHLEFSISQHRCLGEAVPTLHQVNHIEHRQEGQRDVDIAAVARALRMQDVVRVGHRGGIHIGAGGGDENVDAAESTPGERSKTAVHEEGQEEALPVGLPTQGGAQRLLDRPLLRGGKRRKRMLRCRWQSLHHCLN